MPGMGNGRRARVLTCSAIMLTVVTGVAGCGGKTSAGGSSTATSTSVTASSTSAASPTSTSSSASSTLTAPATGNPALGIKGLPDTAKQKTTDGAIAFVKYYVSVINQVGSVPSDAKLLAGMSADSCKPCSGWDAESAANARRGVRFSGNQIPLASKYDVAANLLDSTPPAVHVRGYFGAGTYDEVRTDGTLIEKHDVDPLRVVFLLQWTGGGWITQNVQRDSMQTG